MQVKNYFKNGKRLFTGKSSILGYKRLPQEMD